MIQLDHFAFATPPRTGSTWFIQACSEMGLSGATKTNLHIPFPAAWKGFSVSLIRNPADWLVSYFDSLRGGRIGVPAVDLFADYYSPNNLEQSVNNYLKSCLGMIGKMFDSYQADTVMKLEDFPWAPIEFFQSLGCKRCLDLKTHPPQNGRKQKTQLSLNLRKKILEHESEWCGQNEYYY